MSAISLSAIRRKAVAMAAAAGHVTEEMKIMKLMILGSFVLAAGASAAVLVETGLSQGGMVLACFVGGTFGLCSFIGVYGVSTAKEVAQQGLAAVPTAGATGSCFALALQHWAGVEIGLAALIGIGWLVGFAGPYALRKYGQRFADLIAQWGESRVKKDMGE